MPGPSPGRSGLGPAILILVAANLVIAIAAHYRDTSQKPTPATGSIRRGDDRKPYRSLVNLEYWTFTPRQATYAMHGEVEDLLPGTYAVVPTRNPAYAAVFPTDMQISPSARLLHVSRRQTPQGYASVAPVIAPVRPLKAGDVFRFDVSWKEARVPYLHDEHRPHYMLSIREADLPEGCRTLLCFGIPASVTNVTAFDMQPQKLQHFPGWTVYQYNGTGQQTCLIHLGFTMTTVPPQPPPSASVVFSGS